MELFLGLQRRFHPYGTQATSTVLTEIEDNQVVSELTPNSFISRSRR
jgi:hypothetical protein